MIRGFRASMLGAVLVALLSTAGDFIWAMWIPSHEARYGVMHGALLFAGIGLVLGLPSGRAASGSIAGALTGLLAAAAFYVLAPAAGIAAMFVVWFAVWVALGVLTGWLRREGRFGEALVRGILAAAASGAAFYSVSGIWLPFAPRGWDYVVHFGAWVVAYVPGFAALLLLRR